MKTHLTEKPDLSEDKSNYGNLSEKIFRIRETTSSEMNSIMMDGGPIMIDDSFSRNLSFLISVLDNDGIEGYDCHDAAYMLSSKSTRRNSGPLDSAELNGIGFHRIGHIDIEAGDKGLFGSMDRIFSRDKLMRGGKIRIRYQFEGRSITDPDFRLGDIIIFTFVMNGGHSMTYVGKKDGKDMFLSKLGTGQVSLHDMEDIYVYYGLSEAIIYRKG